MLVYEPEVVLLVEIKLLSLRNTAAANLSLDDEQYVRNRIAALEVLQEERQETQKKLRRYHERPNGSTISRSGRGSSKLEC